MDGQALHFAVMCGILIVVSSMAQARSGSADIPLLEVASARNVAINSPSRVVRLRGTVTAFSGWKNSFFLQDGNSAISVDRQENAAVQVGNKVELTGRVQPGLFANVFLSEEARVLGSGSFPTPLQTTDQELQNGAYDSRLVEVTGTIHEARFGEMWGRKMLFLDLQNGASSITVYLPNQLGGDFQYLVDSDVRVQGVCGTMFNDHRQLIGLRLFVDDIQQISVLKNGKSLASIPVSPLDSLLTFHGPPLNHRVHVKGTVTYQDSAGDVILQMGRSALWIRSPFTPRWKIGTTAEAWGFVITHGYLPYLENASLREVRTGDPLAPVDIQPSGVFKLENGFLQAPYNGLIVRMGAKIVERGANTGATIWTLVADGVRFEAQLANAPRSWALGFESGTEITVTGICIAEIDQTNKVRAFHILLRSPSDLRVIARPYWNQSLVVLSITYLALLIAGVAIFTFLQRKFPDYALQDETSNDTRFQAACRRFSQVLSVLALLIALGLLTSTPKQASPLLAASIAIVLRQRYKSQVFQVVELLCITLIILDGTAGLLDGGTNWVWLRVAQMPLSTAVSLLMIGCSSLVMSVRRLVGVGQMLAVSVGVTALLSLAGALYGSNAGNGLAAHLFMPAPSALALLFLSMANLLSIPDHGLMKTICSQRLGGMMLRRLIPAAVFVPLTIGWIRLQLQLLGLFDTRFGLTFFALSSVVCFCFLLWTTAAILNHLDFVKAKADETLREREQKLELIFAPGSMGDWVWNVELDSLAAHPSVWKLYGEPEKRGSERAEWFRSRQHPDDRLWLEQELSKTVLYRHPLDCEFRVIWPDSSIHWVYCRAVPIFDASGKLAQMSGINLDVTNRKIAEAKLKEGEELFRKLQDAMPQIVWTANAKGDITYSNQRWYDYTGLRPDDDWSSIVRKEELGSILEKWSDAITSGRPYENKVEIRRVDGAFRWHLVRGIPVYDNQGTLQQWFGTSTDIHDFKRANDELYSLNEGLERRVEMRSHELAKAERKFRLLVESVKDYAIYMLDATGRVISWNEGAERLKGYSGPEIIGRHFSIFFRHQDVIEGEPERLLVRAAVEGHVSEETQRVKKDGSVFWVNVVINAVYDDDGGVSGFSKVVRDVTDRRRAEQLLIAARKQAEEANQAKSRFLASMSHEIRTPMNAILGMADLLWDTVLDRTQREYVGRFRRAGANLLSLINDILDLSKIEAGRFELEAIDFDLLELVDRTMEIVSSGAALKGIRIETQIASATPALLVGDPMRLQQILNNLMSNAIKFTPAGTVSLQIGPHTDGRVGHLQFAVNDTGIGIPAHKLSAIFEDFTQAEDSTTRRFGGTGLGLGICRRLIEKMSGTLTVESVLAQGSTFRFDAAFSVGAMAIAPIPKELSDLAGKSVLVIDDNATNRMIISEMCLAWGMKTRLAASSAEALLLMTKARLAKEEFALVLLDRVLPDTRGFDTLREIKCLDPALPVIISSSDHQLGDMTEAKALGAAAYLMKPVRRIELRSCIFEALSTAAINLGKDLAENRNEVKLALKLLLVEDSEDNRFLVQAYLTGTSYELEYAEDGEQAVNAFASGKFDLILMDIQMPIMDGLTATTRIRGIEKERSIKPIPILALTANALQEDSYRSLQAGCDGHLSKPISKEKLVAAIEHYANQRSAAEMPPELVQKTGENYEFRIPPGFETISRNYIRKQLDGVAQIRSSLVSGRVDELRIVGHQMKGSGSSYGFQDLTALGAAIEEAAKVSDLKQLEIEVSRVERYVQLAVESLG